MAPRTLEPWLFTRRGRAALAAAALLAFVAALVLLQPWHGGGGAVFTAISGSPRPSRPLGVPAVLALGVFTSLISAALLLGSIRSRSEVSLDEGGVRWRRAGRAFYVPYSEIDDARLATRAFGGRVLVLVTARSPVRLVLHDTRPLELFGLLLKRIGRKRTGGAPSAETSMLARDGRDLVTWLAAVRAATRTASANVAYRAQAVDFDALERMLVDDAAPIDLRAAAAHALLANEDEERASRAAFAIGAGAPPLVVGAALMAPGGRARIDAGVREEAIAFLGREDRMAVEAGVRLRVVEVEADADADADAEANAEANAEAMRLRR